MGRDTVRYSEAFKLQVVAELGSGHLASHQEARRRYGIGGAATVGQWVRRYGPAHLQRRVIHVATTDERSQVAALKARIKELERAVVDSKVQECLHKAYFDIVCREYGVADPAEVKKNIVAKLSKEGSGTESGRPASR